ncbi:hypothetical protein [Photobacterium kasasachensis]|uniref:hypothetical protein n=1 Tax=Photobacterium kasasachensis TaxID=2910240 RepID=UPI003D131214
MDLPLQKCHYRSHQCQHQYQPPPGLRRGQQQAHGRPPGFQCPWSGEGHGRSGGDHHHAQLQQGGAADDDQYRQPEHGHHLQPVRGGYQGSAGGGVGDDGL